MLKFILTLILVASTLGMMAQTKFTEHLQKSTAGQGTVKLHQSQRITELVNGDISASLAKTKATGGQTASSGNVKPEGDSVNVISIQPTAGVKVRMNGYRIQVYSGGNSRNAKNEASMMGQRVKSMFGGLSVYTNFISPHWICRVGDFKSYEEANEVYQQMKATGRFSEAVIVKSKITAYY